LIIHIFKTRLLTAFNTLTRRRRGIMVAGTVAIAVAGATSSGADS